MGLRMFGRPEGGLVDGWIGRLVLYRKHIAWDKLAFGDFGDNLLGRCTICCIYKKDVYRLKEYGPKEWQDQSCQRRGDEPRTW